MTPTHGHPENAPEFAGLTVNSGVAQPPAVNPYLKPRRRTALPSAADLVEGILKGDVTRLARAVTLVESIAPQHQALAQEVIEKCLPHSGHSRRIGITGVPGAGKSTSIETLEKKLLRGDALSIVDHIERPGLEELYNHLRSGFDEKPFDSLAVNAAEASSDVQERDLLLADKRRLERALKRLNAIYLYGDEEIPGKDFILDRKSITDSLQQIDDRLKELDAAAVFDVSLSDDEFMEKASQFILTQQLLDKRSVNYEKFIRKIDPRIVKDFLNETVSNFCIKDGLTTSVLFKNGIELRFCYKAQQ